MKSKIIKIFSLIICVTVLFSMLSFNSFKVGAQKYNTNTDWLAGKYGISMHYLLENAAGAGATVDAFNEVVNSFDVNKFAKTASDVGASWVLVTMSQSTGITCAPNTYMEETTGLKLGTDRDLILDLYDALEPYGIKVMIYFAGGVPQNNSALARAIGANERVGQADMINGQSGADFVYKYSTSKYLAGMFKDFSDRYGDKVSGWWIDGCYDFTGFNERIAVLYTNALKSGNPNSIVALNGGTESGDCRYEYEDFHCGERWAPTAGMDRNTIYKDNPHSRWTDDGYQQHYWTYLGDNWGARGTSHDTKELLEQSHKILSSGAALTFDISTVSIDKTGTVDPDQVAQLKELKSHIQSNLKYQLEEAPEITKEEDTDNTEKSEDSTVNETKTEVKIINQNKWIYISFGVELVLFIVLVLLFVLRKQRKKV